MIDSHCPVIVQDPVGKPLMLEPNVQKVGRAQRHIDDSPKGMIQNNPKHPNIDFLFCSFTFIIYKSV